MTDFRDALRAMSGPVLPPSVTTSGRYALAASDDEAAVDLGPGLVQHSDGTVWVVNPDGSETQVGVGGSQPHTNEFIAGNDVLIGNGAQGTLPWNTKTGGDTLLDISDPTAPTVIIGGVYAFYVLVECDDALTAGGFYQAALTLDTNGNSAEFVAADAQGTALDGTANMALTAVYYVPAGGGVLLQVTNKDGVQDLNFLLGKAIIQRIS